MSWEVRSIVFPPAPSQGPQPIPDAFSRSFHISPSVGSSSRRIWRFVHECAAMETSASFRWRMRTSLLRTSHRSISEKLSTNRRQPRDPHYAGEVQQVLPGRKVPVKFLRTRERPVLRRMVFCGRKVHPSMLIVPRHASPAQAWFSAWWLARPWGPVCEISPLSAQKERSLTALTLP